MECDRDRKPGEPRRDQGEQLQEEGCSHKEFIREVTPSGEGCKECLEMGDTWVHLRLCLTCGQVGCCDNSKNKHATGHYKETEHAIIQSYQPEEGWRYCYPDDAALPDAKPFR